MHNFFLRYVLIGSCLISYPAYASDIDGDWSGVLMDKLHLIVHVSNAADGSLSATLESVDQGGGRMPVDELTISADHMYFSIAKIGGSYDARWNSAAQSWQGTWTQGRTFPLDFKRTPAQAMQRKRPQEESISAAPLPYLQDEVRFNSSAQNVTLAGTLTRPNGNGPFPAVLLIAGSGPQARDEIIESHHIFGVLADFLTRQGIAVLRYDKRGNGQSNGDFPSATTSDFIDDADGALHFLANNQQIDTQHIGLLGHSEGGLIAPAVAVRNSSASFIVLLAGPGLTGKQILVDQTALIAAANGAAASAVAQAKANQQAVLDTLTSATNSPDAVKQLQIYFNSKAHDMNDAQIKSAIATLTSPWFMQFIRYDPLPVLRKVNVPVLALNGSLDTQVSAQRNLDAIRSALEGRDVTVQALPGLNHLFQTAVSGAPSEYARIEQTFSPDALGIIGLWIKQHVHTMH